MNEAIGERFRRLEPLIDRALELSGEERERFLALCESIHPDLIGDLRTALAEDGVLMPMLGGLAEELTRDKPTNRHGLRAGSWRLLEKIGRGGMGTVYLAERADGAFEKRAAIKLLRGNDPRFREQLERERRVLAKLDHPGIARLIDGGLSDDGQPWLVMELAEGENLDVWLARAKPSLRKRLDVFLLICEAVAYAHGALVVHRDLKPSNIRVGTDGSVKLLDFGIAKLLLPDAEPGITRQLALTPEFAAPEQLRSEAITTRTDVYALGALLVLMLTGRGPHPPFDGNLPAYIARIVDEDAPPPSQLAAECQLAKKSSGDGVALSASSLRGDLDAICAQALRRDPARRFASVDALAQDVRRYLAGQPVLAHPPSWRYRVGKWTRRHWGIALLVGAATLGLAAGLAGVLWKSRYTVAERDAARLEAQRSQAVRDYLALMFRQANSGDDAASISAKAVLDQAVAGIEKHFSNDPATRQEVFLTLAEMYVQLGDFLGAEPLLSRFRELDDGTTPSILRVRSHIYAADIANRRGQPKQGCAEAEQALALIHSNRVDLHAALADALTARGLCRRLSGQSDAAIADVEEALRVLSEQTDKTASSLAAAHNNLAAALVQAGRNDEAKTHLEASLKLYAEDGREVTMDTANVMNNLAVAELQRGDPREATKWLTRALTVRRNASGESASLGALMVNLGRVLTLQGHYAEAETFLEDGLRLLRQFTGEDSPDTASAHLGLADWHGQQGHVEPSLTQADMAERLFVAKLGAGHPLTLRVGIVHGQLLARAGRIEQARAKLDALVQALEQADAAQAQFLATALCERAIVLRTRVPDQAGKDAARCLSLRSDHLPESHWEVREAQLLVASFDPIAVPALQAQIALARLIERLGAQSPRVLRAVSWR